MTNKNNEKKYDLSVCPMFTTKTKTGEINTDFLTGFTINDEIYDKLQSVEKGGKFTIRVIPADRRGKVYAYLEYKSKADIEAYAKQRAANNDDI